MKTKKLRLVKSGGKTTQKDPANDRAAILMVVVALIQACPTKRLQGPDPHLVDHPGNPFQEKEWQMS